MLAASPTGRHHETHSHKPPHNFPRFKTGRGRRAKAADWAPLSTPRWGRGLHIAHRPLQLRRLLRLLILILLLLLLLLLLARLPLLLALRRRRCRWALNPAIDLVSNAN